MIPTPLHLATLRAHCRLHKAGMRHSKVTPTYLRNLVEHATCRTYKRGDWDAMIKELTFMLDSAVIEAAACDQ